MALESHNLHFSFRVYMRVEQKVHERGLLLIGIGHEESASNFVWYTPDLILVITQAGIVSRSSARMLSFKVVQAVKLQKLVEKFNQIGLSLKSADEIETFCLRFLHIYERSVRFEHFPTRHPKP